MASPPPSPQPAHRISQQMPTLNHDRAACRKRRRASRPAAVDVKGERVATAGLVLHRLAGMSGGGRSHLDAKGIEYWYVRLHSSAGCDIPWLGAWHAAQISGSRRHQCDGLADEVVRVPLVGAGDALERDPRARVEGQAAGRPAGSESRHALSLTDPGFGGKQAPGQHAWVSRGSEIRIHMLH